MSVKKSFSIGQILSASSGILMCEIGGVYEILNFLTGDNLFTHQLPRAFRECRPHILRQHPTLAEFDEKSVTSENWRSKLEEARIKFGEALDLEPIPRDDHAVKDPLKELEDMVGKDRVIVIRPDKEMGGGES